LSPDKLLKNGAHLDKSGPQLEQSWTSCEPALKAMMFVDNFSRRHSTGSESYGLDQEKLVHPRESNYVETEWTYEFQATTVRLGVVI